MATYILLGKYTQEGVQEISADRTQKASELVNKVGGEIEEIHALLGEYDIFIKAQFPGTGEAMKTSVELANLTGITFTTMPSLSGDEFDKLIEG